MWIQCPSSGTEGTGHEDTHLHLCRLKYSIKRHGGVIKCNAAKVYLAAYSYGEEKMESLFDISDESNAYAPLADRMRPEILDDIIGQDESVGKTLSFINDRKRYSTISSSLWAARMWKNDNCICYCKDD